MPAGRKPKPVHVKKREGNPGKRPLPEIPRLALLSEVPEPPDGLGKAGREAWTLVGRSMVVGGALQEHYLPLMLGFAQAVDLASRAWQDIHEGPLVRTGRGGGKNPNIQTWRDAWALARSLGAAFGATPQDMAQLGLDHMKGMTLQQELLARKAD